MQLHLLTDLIGKPVEGLRACVDIHVDGKREHEILRDPPMIRTLKSVELVKKKDGHWIYWRWIPDNNDYSRGYGDCGYSGVRFDCIDFDKMQIKVDGYQS